MRSRGRSFTRRPKQRTAWVRGVFSEQNVTRAGVINENEIMGPADWQGDTTSLAKTVTAKRILVKGGVSFTPATTTVAFDAVALFMAIYVLDQDDTDATIVSSAAGTILTGSRVLWLDCFAFAGIEVPTAQWGSAFTHQYKVDVDLRVPVRVLSDQQILFALQFGSDVQETINDCRFSAYMSVLINYP